MTFSRTLVHFLKWLVALPLVYLLAGAASGALGYVLLEQASQAYPHPQIDVGNLYLPLDGATYGAFLTLTGALPMLIGLWLIDALMASTLFRKRAGERWVRWVFWGFGLAAGLMPVFAYLSSGLLAGPIMTEAEYATLDPALQERALALAQAGRSASLILTVTLFGLALFTSWWNWRAAGGWIRKSNT